MPCYHPWIAPRSTAWGAAGGKLPCGQCYGCRNERARQWAIRCVHETQLNNESCYITLTYDETHINQAYSLAYRDFQLFMKKLRKKFHPQKIRFYMAGEYGETFSRPHFHACLFGIDFHDKEVIKTNQKYTLYRSPTLESLWKHGFSSLGAVTFQSAAYVARYVMKKITGKPATSHYTWLTEDGELVNRTPEFSHMSLKPGIGRAWYNKYKTDVYPSDQAVTNGRPQKPPRYYDKLYEQEHPQSYLRVKKARHAKVNKADNTTERLKAKEAVAIAAGESSPRKLT